MAQRGILPGHRTRPHSSCTVEILKECRKKEQSGFEIVARGWDSRAGLCGSQHSKRTSCCKTSGLGGYCYAEPRFSCPKIPNPNFPVPKSLCISQQAVADAVQDTRTEGCPSAWSRSAQR